MDRVANGLKLAALAAVALLIVMFLPWYGISAKLPLVGAIAGIVAVVLVADRLLDVPNFGISGPAASIVQVERKAGPFLALLASAAMAAGGLIARAAPRSPDTTGTADRRRPPQESGD